MASDETLFRRWQQGDRQALEELVERYQGRLLAHLYNLVGDENAAADLVQETFLRLVRETRSYHYPRPFFAWMYTIARNLAYKHLGSAHHRHVEWSPPLAENLAESLEVEAEILQRETRRFLADALSRLSMEQRETLSLRFDQQMSVAETARLLGIPEGTVKSPVFQALRLLRSYVQDTALPNKADPSQERDES